MAWLQCGPCWLGFVLVLLDTAVGQQSEAVGTTANAQLQQLECERQRNKYSPTNSSDLFESWLEGYDRFQRPSLAVESVEVQLRGNATADEVRAGLYINQLWGFDEIDGTFMIQAYLTLGWRDPRLCFDGTRLPASRKGSSQKSVELDLHNRVDVKSGVDRLHDLWLPDINIENSIRLAGNVDPDADLFRAYSDGTIEWSRRFVVTLSADLDFSDLPFDTQYMYVNLESYRMPAKDLLLKWNYEGGHGGAKPFPHGLDPQFNNPEWEFYTQEDESDLDQLKKVCGLSRVPEMKDVAQGGIRSHCGTGCEVLCPHQTRNYAGDTDDFSRVEFGMVLKRQTHSWVFGAIVPSVVLCLISYLGLYIARDNPGRPGVHCVTVLAHFTLDASMRTQIPHVGKQMWIDRFQSIMLFSHLVLFLEYTLVHYSARQKYREQVITDARLRKLMAYDEVAAEILGDPQLAEACGLAGYSSTTGDDTNGGGSAPAVTGLASLTPQELERALASMPPEVKRIVHHKLRTARARLGGSVSEWGEDPGDFYPAAIRRRRFRMGSRTASDMNSGRGLFGIGGRETVKGVATLPLATDGDTAAHREEDFDEDAQDFAGGREELGDGSSELNVTPGRELPGTPDKSLQSRRRIQNRATTEHAIVGSLSEPLFGGGSAGNGLDEGPPRLPGQGESSPVEELELGSPDDDRSIREKEWCGGRMRAKARHFCTNFSNWYNEMMTVVLANASNLDRPCRMLFPVVFSFFLTDVLWEAGANVRDVIDSQTL